MGNAADSRSLCREAALLIASFTPQASLASHLCTFGAGCCRKTGEVRGFPGVKAAGPQPRGSGWDTHRRADNHGLAQLSAPLGRPCVVSAACLGVMSHWDPGYLERTGLTFEPRWPAQTSHGGLHAEGCATELFWLWMCLKAPTTVST